MKIKTQIIAGLLIASTVGSASADNVISEGGLTWMPVSFKKNWVEANAYCNNTAINGQTGWRLPTKDELISLQASGVMKNLAVAENAIWSSTPRIDGYHYIVFLRDGDYMSQDDIMYRYYVTCVS